MAIAAATATIIRIRDVFNAFMPPFYHFGFVISCYTICMTSKELLKLTGLPVIAASLCCLSPLILVAFGLSTATFAASLADTLYGDYRWAFRAVGLILLVWSLALYFRRQKGICTLDEAKKRRQEIVNTTLIAVIVAIVGYSIFLYVVVHYAGLPFGIWE